jgi:hypothetical protein
MSHCSRFIKENFFKWTWKDTDYVKLVMVKAERTSNHVKSVVGRVSPWRWFRWVLWCINNFNNTVRLAKAKDNYLMKRKFASSAKARSWSRRRLSFQ